MKNLANTIAETLLVTSFITLLAIPIITFGGFSPTVSKTTVTKNIPDQQEVLGVSTERDGSIVSYKTELLPTDNKEISIEENQKKSDLYEMTIRAYSSEQKLINEDLLRIVNTSSDSITIITKISSPLDTNSLTDVKIKIDNTQFSVYDLIEKNNFEPAITLEPNEWITIGLITEETLEIPTDISVQMKIL